MKSSNKRKPIPQRVEVEDSSKIKSGLLAFSKRSGSNASTLTVNGKVIEFVATCIIRENNQYRHAGAK